MVAQAVTDHLAQIRDLCVRHQIRELSIFGSAGSSAFRPDSDVDVLVEFRPEACIGLIAFAGIKLELEEILGREVDLVTKQGIKPSIRQQVLDSAQVLYAE